MQGKINCVLTTRENLLETNDFDWIGIDNIIDLDQELELNKEIIQGILEKFRKRFPEASTDFEWKQKDAPENLWLLGCILRVFNRLSLPEEGIRRKFKLYYENLTSPRSTRIIPQHILTVLLILSVLSQYETFMEKEFIKNYGITKFPNLNEEDLVDILQLLVTIREILLLQGLTTIKFEYRLPHSKLGHFLLNYYADDQNKRLLDEIFDDYIKHGNNVFELGYNLGLAEEHEKAIECFEKAVKIDPDDQKAWYNMGVAYDDIENYEKAIECYEKAVKINPDYQEALNAMGVAYGKKGEQEKAIECFEKAVKIDPDDQETWYNMGFAYNIKGEHEKVIECFEKAEKIKSARDH